MAHGKMGALRWTLMLLLQTALAETEADERSWYYAIALCTALVLTLCAVWWSMTESPFYDLLPADCDRNVITVRIKDSRQRLITP